MKRLALMIISLAFAAAFLAPVSVADDPSHYTYTIASNKATVTGYTGPGGDIFIPAILGGYPVTSIDFYAFAENSKITHLTLPAGLVSIFEGAFSFCTNLVGIDVPDSLVLIGSAAFSQCTRLSRIAFSTNLIIIGSAAFAACNSLVSLSLPSSLEYLGPSAFFRSTNLTRIALPASLATIGSYTFEGCTRLTRVYFAGLPPTRGSDVFKSAPATLYYIPAYSSSWPSTYAGCPTAPWLPSMSSAARVTDDGQFGFTTFWAAGQTVQIQACTNLTAPDWTTLCTTNIPASGSLTLSDPDSPNHPTRFYRIIGP